MKPLYLLVLILIILSCQEKSDLLQPNEESPKSKDYQLVKMLRYANSTTKQPGGGTEYTYDSDGNLVKESLFDYPNTVFAYRTYEYQSGKMIKKSNFDGQVGNLSLGTYIIYFYDNGHLIKENLFIADGTLRYSTYYKYDGENLINTYKDGAGLGIHHQYKYFFDQKNRLEREENYMYNQELSSLNLYYYDTQNRLIRTEFYDHNKELSYYEERKYQDDSDLHQKEINFNKDGSIMTERTLSYDTKGNLIQIQTSDGCVLYKKKYSGELLMEQITYLPPEGCSEWMVNRYEYRKKSL